MPVPRYSVEELEALLERSSLPSLVTEGSDDYSLMRHLATDVGGDCLPVGGKRNVIKAVESPALAGRPKTGFMVDRDLWLFSDVPAHLEGLPLVITDGYSIENDLLRDADAESLLDPAEQGPYEQDLDGVCEWFAAGVTGRLAGEDLDLNIKVSKLVDDDGLTDEARALIDQFPPDPELSAMIRGNYPKLLRGKTWLGTICRHISAQGRLVQHSPLSVLTYGMRSGKEHSANLIDQIDVLLGKS